MDRKLLREYLKELIRAGFTLAHVDPDKGIYDIYFKNVLVGWTSFNNLSLIVETDELWKYDLISNKLENKLGIYVSFQEEINYGC